MATINDPNTAANIATVKAASTATVATDVALVVQIHPSTPAVAIKGNAGGLVDGATAVAVPANALHVGGKAATANPVNAVAGTLTALMLDKGGRLVVTPSHVRELVAKQQTTVSATAETTIITAGGASVFCDLVGLVISTAGLAAQTITIKDATAGTTQFILDYPNAAVAPGQPLVLQFSPPIPQTAANNNWTVTQSVATACHYTAIFSKNL